MKLLHVEGGKAAAKSFISLARSQSRISWQIRHVHDAYEGIDYLSGFKDFADRTRFPLPQILVVRLGARSANALDLLAWLRGENQFRRLPVVVANARAGSTERVSAQKLTPRAWFVETADGHAVLSLCEDLALNACTQFGLLTSSAAWPLAGLARANEPGSKGLVSRNRACREFPETAVAGLSRIGQN